MITIIYRVEALVQMNKLVYAHQGFIDEVENVLADRLEPVNGVIKAMAEIL